MIKVFGTSICKSNCLSACPVLVFDYKLRFLMGVISRGFLRIQEFVLYVESRKLLFMGATNQDADDFHINHIVSFSSTKMFFSALLLLLSLPANIRFLRREHRKAFLGFENLYCMLKHDWQFVAIYHLLFLEGRHHLKHSMFYQTHFLHNLVSKTTLLLFVSFFPRLLFLRTLLLLCKRVGSKITSRGRY